MGCHCNIEMIYIHVLSCTDAEMVGLPLEYSIDGFSINDTSHSYHTTPEMPHI